MKVKVVIEIDFPESYTEKDVYGTIKLFDRHLTNFIDAYACQDKNFNVNYYRNPGWMKMDLLREY